MLAFLAANPQLPVVLLAALAGFMVIVVLCWPMLVRDDLSERVRQITGDAARTPVRAQTAASEVSLRSEPKRLFKVIVESFNLAKQAEDGEIVNRLRKAGYRGSGPVITYLAARLLAPLALFLLGILYTFFVMPFDLPPLTKAMLPLLAGGLGYYAPAIFIKNRITKRQKAIQRAWPEALDLLLICVEAGMSIEGAFRKVSQEIGIQSRELAEELSLTTAELSYLPDRRTAYTNLSDRTGLEGVKATVTALVQAEKYGTSVGQALRVLAQENRDMRMSFAEKRAAALPPKLTVPMIIFFLPVLFAVIITPAIIQIMGTQ